MDKHSVFSKTGKGLLEIKNKSNRLPKEQFRILNLVDGKTVFADLAAQSRIPEIELRKVVTALEDGGYIKELISQTDENDPGSGVSDSSAEDDLDFTKMLTDTPPPRTVAPPPPPPPPPQPVVTPTPPKPTPRMQAAPQAVPPQPTPRPQAPPPQEQPDQRSRLEEAYTRRQAEEQQRKAQQPKPVPAPPPEPDQEEGADLESELEALRNQMAPSPGPGLTTQPTTRPVIETQPGADTAEPPRDLNDAFERARRDAEQRAREEAVRMQQAAMERRSRTPRKPGK
jgi:hypothetical protein